MCMARSATAPCSPGALGLHARAAGLQAQATALRHRFENAFWCDDLSVYALALDGDEAALPRGLVELGAGAAHGHGVAGTRAPPRADAALAVDIQRLGHPHRCFIRCPLQPDVVSQWLGVAARQRA